jgi:hypothetical protein
MLCHCGLDPQSMEVGGGCGSRVKPGMTCLQDDKPQAAFLIWSIGSAEVASALAGMPFFHGRSTG